MDMLRGGWQNQLPRKVRPLKDQGFFRKVVNTIQGSTVRSREGIQPVNIRARSSLRVKENFSGYAFISPSVLLFAVFVLLPFIYSFYLSLNKWQGGRMDNITFAGFSQYQRALSSPDFWHSIAVTAYYTFVTVFLQIVFAFILALVLNRRVFGRSWLRTAYFVPVVMSTIVVAIIWNLVLDSGQSGLLNEFLSMFAIPPINWLTTPKWAMPSLIIMSVWKWVGYLMVIFLAGLQDIPNELYEAASIEGAGGWQKVRYVTIPLLEKTTWFLVITSIINSFQVFDQIYLMTGGGPLNATNVIVYYIYQWAFQNFDISYASAAAWLLFIIIFAITLFQIRFARAKW